MADSKITQLPENTAPVLTDIIPIVDDPSGTAVTQKVTLTNIKTGLALVKADVGLGNVDNTSDANKPVSSATQTAIDAKVADAINNGTTTVAPSQNAVFDELALKANTPTLVATLASDAATGADTTPISLTGLIFTYAINSTYRIWFTGRVQPAANTTGCGFQFDLSSAVTSINLAFYHQLANTGTLSGGHSIADDASVGVSSGMPGTSTYPVSGQGLLITTSNTGTAQLRFRSETTAVTTAKAGLTLVVEKIA